MRKSRSHVPEPVDIADASVRTVLFLGAYAPLFALLAIRFVSPWLWGSCAALSAAGFLGTFYLAVREPRAAADIVQVEEVADQGGAVSGFLATYLLPFLTVTEPSIRDVAAYALFLIVSWLIYVRSDMLEINPTLYILGRRVSSFRSAGGFRGFAISRRRLKPGARLRKVNLSSNIVIEVAEP